MGRDRGSPSRRGRSAPALPLHAHPLRHSLSHAAHAWPIGRAEQWAGAAVANGSGCSGAVGQSAGPGNILVGVGVGFAPAWPPLLHPARALLTRCMHCLRAACAKYATTYALRCQPARSSRGSACSCRRRCCRCGAARSARRGRGARRTTGGSWMVNGRGMSDSEQAPERANAGSLLAPERRARPFEGQRATPCQRSGFWSGGWPRRLLRARAL